MPAPERGRWTWWQSLRGKLLGAALVGALAAGLSLAGSKLPNPGNSDFSDLWLGARALLDGQNPYAVVRALHPDVALYYPLPAMLLVLPLGLLRRATAEAVFVGVGMAALAYAGLSVRTSLLIACASAAALVNVAMGQWSPLMTASAVLPNLGFVLAAKPSIGLVIAAGYLNRRALALATGFTALSLVVWPGWPLAWLEGLRGGIHMSPLLRPGGALLLLALIRWRRPEARMLAALACVPQTGMLYEALPLALIPRTRVEAYVFVILTDVAALAWSLRTSGIPVLVEAIRDGWPCLLVVIYLPMLVMVLRRSNQPGDDPVRP